MFLPGKSHGQRSLADYGLWDHKRVGQDVVTKQQVLVVMKHDCYEYALQCSLRKDLMAKSSIDGTQR